MSNKPRIETYKGVEYEFHDNVVEDFRWTTQQLHDMLTETHSELQDVLTTLVKTENSLNWYKSRFRELSRKQKEKEMAVGKGKGSAISVKVKQKIDPKVPTKNALGTKENPVKGNTSGKSAYKGK